MKTLNNFWFLSFCLIWFLVFVGRKFGVIVPYFNGYLTDLFAVPVIANLSLAFQRRMVERSDSWCFKPGHLIFIIASTSLVFEFYLPQSSSAYTADPMDIVMYVTGGIFFWITMNRPVEYKQEVRKKAFPENPERQF